MGMAGNASGCYIDDTASEVPFTTQSGSITGWVLRSSLTQNAVASVGQNTNVNACISLQTGSGSTSIAGRIVDDAGVGTSFGPSLTDVVGFWSFGCAAYTSTSSRRITSYSLGGPMQDTANATAATTAAFDRFAVGAVRVQATNTIQVASGAIIGGVGFWNRPLSLIEAKELGSGRHPFRCAARDALVYYFPLVNSAICAKTGLALTASGTAPPWLPSRNPPVQPIVRIASRAKAPAVAGFFARPYYDMIGQQVA